MTGEQRVVSAGLVVDAPAGQVFELIADPARQPSWDGNDNLGSAPPGQRVRRVGDVFSMTLTGGAVRENHVVELEEGRRIAWRPAEVGCEPPGHLWRWELEPRPEGTTEVTHTYDWAQLSDEGRYERARATTPERLLASLTRLARAAARPAGLPALFAGIPVADYPAALDWYARFLGAPASFHPNDDEAVWEVAPGRSVYVRHLPGRAGHAVVTLFVDDLGERVGAIAARGLAPEQDETYANGVRKVTYRDPEGNEIGLGG